MTVSFRHQSDFAKQREAYSLLPFRFARIPGLDGRVLLTSEAGEFLFLPNSDFDGLISGTLSSSNENFQSLEAKQFILTGSPQTAIRLLSTKLRTKKAYLQEGPSLHIFVVTLRCDHSCAYCQVSRQSAEKARFDMSIQTANLAVARVFESPSRSLTVEFQGGEPLLALPVIKHVVSEIERRNEIEKRSITFTITSTLHFASADVLEFFKAHNFQVSVSLDGPEAIHNANRPNPTRNSHALTVQKLAETRDALGDDKVSALTTLTQRSLDEPEAIIGEYVRLGFRSIFLRPLSPFGFAVKSRRRTGYDMQEFVRFYDRALAYIINLNRNGMHIEEAYTSILLTHILTPFSSHYVDLRSPAGGALGVLVYNYDGGVYASDESRMLAEMYDDSFRLGAVDQPYHELMGSTAAELLLATGIAETLPGCSDCAFLQYCGADPVQALATEGDPVGHRAHSLHCKRHMGVFNILFRHLAEADPYVMRLFTAWITRKSPLEITRPQAV